MNKISMFTVIKIGFLILFSVFQIFMITSIFNSDKIVNKISINSINSYDPDERL